ncbi:hypothetical protein TRVL_02560 [Trypanosoma vivax]|nr:hypothetical protein TRVL_02560 [Trypanosoma vivax]
MAMVHQLRWWQSSGMCKACKTLKKNPHSNALLALSVCWQKRGKMPVFRVGEVVWLGAVTAVSTLFTFLDCKFCYRAKMLPPLRLQFVLICAHGSNLFCLV